MEDTIQDKLDRLEKHQVKQWKEISRLSRIVKRLNREHITPVSEASAQAREVLR